MDDELGDLESPSTSENTGISELPDWAKRQVSQANKEAEGLRHRLKEREQEILTSKYEAVIDLLPEEVTSYDGKVAFLEKATARFAPTQEASVPTVEAETPEPPSEERQEAEARLATVATGPSGSATPGALTGEDAMNLALTDPERYAKLRDQGLVRLPKLEDQFGRSPGHLS